MKGRDGSRPRRLSFLAAAERVLEHHGGPLPPEEITLKAIEAGYIRSFGLTPSQTMKSKLSTDVLIKKEKSRFKRTDPNVFALRVWADIPEYFADRFQKALLDEDIIVFDARILRRFFPENGITTLSAEQGQELIGYTYPMRRSEAELTYDVIQLVSQFLVIHRSRIATHRRTRRLPETRLHGAYSLLFGGHLNPSDIAPLFGPFDPVGGPLYIQRELSEEVRIYGGSPSLQLAGGIYDPRRDVSRQHLGVLYVVRVSDESTIEIGERGFLQHLTFDSIEILKSRIDAFENWSELVFRTLILEGRVAV